MTITDLNARQIGIYLLSVDIQMIYRYAMLVGKLYIARKDRHLCSKMNEINMYDVFNQNDSYIR